MPEFRIDTEVATSIREQYVGSNSWAGFLIGRVRTGEILGHVLAPAEKQSWDEVEIRREYVEALAGILNARLVPNLELAGLLILAPGTPRQWAIDLYCRTWRGLLKEGACIVYSAPVATWREGRELVCYEVATAKKTGIREVDGLRGAAGRATEQAIAEYWNRVAELQNAERGRDGAAPARTLSCLLDRKMVEHVEEYARTLGRVEVGGVLLGTRDGATTRVAAAILPPQTTSASVRCEFETSSLSDICRALEDVLPGRWSRRAGFRPVGWIHTHPWLGVFLSAVDRRTFGDWCKLDPGAVALVVDPHATKDGLAVFGADADVLSTELISAPSVGGLTRPEARRMAEILARRTRKAAEGWAVVSADGVTSS